MNYLLAIDLGTSSTRAAVYSTDGALHAVSQHPLTQNYPQKGWVEQDPEVLWEATKTALLEVFTEIHVNEVAACGLTNQRETTVIWNRETGQCLYPAIVWQDRRTEAFCRTLSKHYDLIHTKTGLLPDPYFSATKLYWLFQELPEARRLALDGKLAFGTMDTYLIWRLTGGQSHVTDITNASRTLLFNIISQSWDRALLDLFEVPMSILPEVLPCDAHFGVIDKALLGAGIPITGVAGDQQAALIGQGCFEPGMVKATFGTGGFLLLNTGESPVFSKHQLLTTMAYQIQGKTVYGLEGNMYQAGTTVKWLRDEMKLIKTADETEHCASSLKSNDGVYLVPSFTGLGAPHWLSTSGALMAGLSRTTTPAHVARAALESVAYQTRELLECMREDSGFQLSLLRVDGGMSVNQWLLQFLASQCNLEVQRPAYVEATLFGAAMLAALGSRLIDDTTSLQNRWHYEQAYSPSEDRARVELDYEGWQHAIAMLKQG